MVMCLEPMATPAGVPGTVTLLSSLDDNIYQGNFNVSVLPVLSKLRSYTWLCELLFIKLRS